MIRELEENLHQGRARARRQRHERPEALRAIEARRRAETQGRDEASGPARAGRQTRDASGSWQTLAIGSRQTRRKVIALGSCHEGAQRAVRRSTPKQSSPAATNGQPIRPIAAVSFGA